MVKNKIQKCIECHLWHPFDCYMPFLEKKIVCLKILMHNKYERIDGISHTLPVVATVFFFYVFVYMVKNSSHEIKSKQNRAIDGVHRCRCCCCLFFFYQSTVHYDCRPIQYFYYFSVQVPIR